MSQVESFRQIANVLRAAQRSAIEAENAPDRRKRLRHFSLHEAAGILDVPLPIVRRAMLGVLAKSNLAGRTRLSFEELQQIRQALLPPGSGGAQARTLGTPAPANLATVAFSNFKGGSAKTTSAVHCAQYLALAGYRVLLVDLDSQASATAQFGIDPATEVGMDNSFAAWTACRDRDEMPNAARLCQRTYWPLIDLVPAGAVLAAAEESLARRAAAGAPERVLYFEELKAFLHQVQDAYDIAIVDTRPDVNMLMTAALHAATGVIVPTRATMTDLASTGEYFAHLASYLAEYETAFGQSLGLSFTKILVTAFDPADRSQEAFLELVRDQFGPGVLSAPFLHSRVVGTAGFGKQTIYEYEPSTDRAAYLRVLASANAVNRAIEQEVLATCGRITWQANTLQEHS